MYSNLSTRVGPASKTEKKLQTDSKQRAGTVVSPHCRLSEAQVRLVDETSRRLLEDPGLISFSPEAVQLFKDAGAKIDEEDGRPRIQIPSSLIDKYLKTAPGTVVLGARDPDNRLVLDADEPRVRFGSGSETNTWLSLKFNGSSPELVRQAGSIRLLKRAAHLCENLEHLDFFIRCVNIQDSEVTEQNKDVNKFFASLNNITKHVQAGLTSLSALDDIVQMGRIAAGGEEAFEKEPVLSFITCVIKSPLQIVNDTARTLIEVARRRVPLVVSSCPMGGTTGPFDEFGMVALINAELLSGVVLTQLASPGTPVLYGSVPVRSRLDNLNDMYGAPEFNHYNLDCVQMARFYHLPCYSTAGVADTDTPGIQATVEKMLTLSSVPFSGAQYIHYAFGLLDRTSTFCPEQAVMDNEHIGIIKRAMRDSPISAPEQDRVLSMVREVMQTSHKTFMYHLPLPTRDDVYVRYPLENSEGGPLLAAHRRVEKIMELPRKTMPAEVRKEIKAKVKGILPHAYE
jgi:trimethylamine--corrinoid protein Co-methyltransferase